MTREHMVAVALALGCVEGAAWAQGAQDPLAGVAEVYVFADIRSDLNGQTIGTLDVHGLEALMSRRLVDAGFKVVGDEALGRGPVQAEVNLQVTVEPVQRSEHCFLGWLVFSRLAILESVPHPRRPGVRMMLTHWSRYEISLASNETPERDTEDAVSGHMDLLIAALQETTQGGRLTMQ